MKKIAVVVVFIASICLSAFAGNYFSDKENMNHREQRSHQMIVFAVSNIEELKAEYDSDVMECLISNIYAAYEYSEISDLSAALHDLWNAFIFDGENITGREDALIKALQDKNPKTIKDIAMSMRTAY